MKLRRCDSVGHGRWSCRNITALAITALTAMPCLAGGGVPGYDFNWAAIGSVNNPGVPASFGGPLRGRGSVGYEYRISTLEITSAQWLEFVNTYTTQSEDLAHFGTFGLIWGAESDPDYAGPGQRWRLIPSHSTAAMNPVYGINWRDAAMYCNWLHNDKQPTLDAIANGAYDASTFTFNPDGTFNDQAAHSPGAKYWIPTLDEWMKAVHFDPNRFGEGQPGWWLHSNSSDTLAVPGLPGIGETSATLGRTSFDAFGIPLGAYPQTRTPWGLLDASGGAEEWTEEILFPFQGHRNRGTDGPSIVLDEFAYQLGDRADRLSGGSTPTAGVLASFRIASAVPPPATIAVGWSLIWITTRRKR